MGNSVEFVTTDHNASMGGNPLIVALDLTAIAGASKDETDLSGPYHSLLSRAYSLQAAIDAATAEIKTSDLAFWEAEYETARAAARSALDAYNTANNQELRYRNALQRAIDERTNSIAHLNAVKGSKPSPALFPSADEIARWESAVGAAQKTVDEKIAEFDRASRTIQMYYSDLNEMGAVLNAASEKEMQLRVKVNALKGVANTAPDSKTGLKQRVA